MSFKYKLGVFVEAGGNKVFFANGVLNVLDKEGICIDKIAGLSSSGPIILAYLLHKNDEALEIFAKRLYNNKKNFYLFRREHFPHNDIYRNSIEDLLRDDYRGTIQSDFTIFATTTTKEWATIKSFLVSLLLILHSLRINFLKSFRLFFNIHKIIIGNESLEDNTAVPLKSKQLHLWGFNIF